ncbi:unnamed protein product [Medioppia subpectinata]|uniref:Phospholipid/glycerol acyltransferase domain-containing protein n=1 Tax=Medioppia subpectinata TaxID=1979941 RepID=A0A7R9Q0U3_9ACAR|nr:unnamed protein product [Medioppia subpectinata]CAG2107664.1 unnamed protein product [Medioppia subpectinata]
MLYHLYPTELLAVIEWWSRSTITVYFPDDQSRHGWGRESAILVSNHRYEIDSLALLQAAYAIECPHVKYFIKREFRFVPVIGWTLAFGESIFLDRDWRRDSRTIGPALGQLWQHKRPVMVALTAEGTRYTPDKFKASQRWAQEKDLPVRYKHHLIPRVKGFALVVRYLKVNCPNAALYNIEFAFDETKVTPSLLNYIQGVSQHCSLYVKRIPIESIPTDNDQQVEQFMYGLFTVKVMYCIYLDTPCI